jgi:hypothetical protein
MKTVMKLVVSLSFTVGAFAVMGCGNLLTAPRPSAAAKKAPDAVIPLRPGSVEPPPYEVIWSHDGQEILFNQVEEIRAVNVSTRASRLVTTRPGQIMHPMLALSEDGGVLYYRDGQRGPLYRVGVNGQGQELVAPAPVLNYAVSPDGSRIAFASMSGSSDGLFVYDAATKASRPVKLDVRAFPLAFSPNGQEVLCQARNNWLPGTQLYQEDCMIASLETGASRPLEIPRTPEWGRGMVMVRPRWDAEGIQYCAYGLDATGYWVGVRNTTKNDTVWRRELGRDHLRDRAPEKLAWSADGAKVAWIHHVFGPPRTIGPYGSGAPLKGYTTWVADLQSGEVRQIGEHIGAGQVWQAALSRDGKRLALLVLKRDPEGRRLVEIHVWDVPQ